MNNDAREENGNLNFHFNNSGDTPLMAGYKESVLTCNNLTIFIARSLEDEVW